jgi:hypothetical protein
MNFVDIAGVAVIALGVLAYWGPPWLVNFLYAGRRRYFARKSEVTLVEYKYALRNMSWIIVTLGLFMLCVLARRH